MALIPDILLEARIAARAFADYVGGGSLRLGVTGLSRAGKTIFITALVDALTRVSEASQAGARNHLPVFRVHAEGRLVHGALDPQPDDNVPRFAYEDHLAALHAGPDRHWPQSTRRISQLRLTLEFESETGWRKGARHLSLDIVDYPGEWLLDLPLLEKSYAQWSSEMLDAARGAARASLSAEWRGFLAGIDAAQAADENVARKAAEIFTSYLRACRDEKYALSTLPPGRFLMPGDLEGSPALTFAPLPLTQEISSGSLAAMMERRFEAYKRYVVQPFFRDHFARIDRQIVLVDALAAINSGPAALRDLELALGDVLLAFRTGENNLLSSIFRPRADKILFAATKADHLHHASHDRLEAILRQLTMRAIHRAEGVGAKIDVIALAALRATREAQMVHEGEKLDAIIGTPLAGETIGEETFDGTQEAAVFPGELPDDPRILFRGDFLAQDHLQAQMRFLRFRPPLLEASSLMPHIRLDRALQFLIGDRLA